MINKNWWKDKRVFVTGAKGFIGSALCKELEILGSEVIRDTDKANRNDRWAKFPYGNGESDVDIVFHLAARTVMESTETGLYDVIYDNSIGTLDILEGCRKIHKTNNLKVVIIISSDKVYGDNKVLKVPYKETDPLIGLQPYDVSKVLSDIMTQAYAKQGLPAGIIRSSNVYGPGDKHLNRIIPGAIDSILKGEAPTIRFATPKRDYLYIDDLIAGFLSVAEYIYEHPSETGEIFNMASGHNISNLDLLSRILLQSKRDYLSIRVLEGDTGKISEQQLDITKAKEILKWKPKISLEEGLRKTIIYWGNNFDS